MRMSTIGENTHVEFSASTESIATIVAGASPGKIHAFRIDKDVIRGMVLWSVESTNTYRFGLEGRLILTINSG